MGGEAGKRESAGLVGDKVSSSSARRQDIAFAVERPIEAPGKPTCVISECFDFSPFLRLEITQISRQ